VATFHDSSRDVTVCLTGPESSGKTTLAEALGRHFGAPVVPEVAREYLAGRGAYVPADVLEIARRQLALEARTRADVRGLLILDTDVLVLAVWWRERFGALPTALRHGLTTRSPRHYLLARPDIPWAEDPLRENPLDRERLFDRHLELLADPAFPHDVIEGIGPVRLERAIAKVAELTAT